MRTNTEIVGDSKNTKNTNLLLTMLSIGKKTMNRGLLMN